MRLLYIKTANEQSHIALYEDEAKVSQDSWTSEKNLGEDLLPRIESMLKSGNVGLNALDAIMIFPGPGSYTGTRIGVSTANALAWSLNIPALACADTKTDEIAQFLNKPLSGFSQGVVPLYAEPPRITVSRKLKS